MVGHVHGMVTYVQTTGKGHGKCVGENTCDVCINTFTVQTGNGGRQSKLKDWNDDQRASCIVTLGNTMHTGQNNASVSVRPVVSC